jgi:type 1 glutamine amidotransferase
MKRIFSLLLLLSLATHAPAELGHHFPPIKPEELAKIQAALPQAVAKPAKPRKLLVFFLTEGYVHGSIPYCNEAVKEMGDKTGAYTADFSEDMGVFTPDRLKDYDAVLFNNTTGLKFTDPAARQALLDFAKSGKGVIGIHSATDNFPTWPEGQALLGGKFDGHPWGAGDTEAVKIDDPASPIVTSFGGKGFWINDEIYQMKTPYDRNEVHELLSLDMARPQNARDPKKLHRTDNDFPICWVKQDAGGGRVFYCSFGHNPSIYWTPQVLQVYLNGIQFALGDFPVDTTPTGKLSAPPPPALAPETPDPINPKEAKPAAPKPTAIKGPLPGILSLVAMAEISATDAPAGDALADGLKAVASYDSGMDRTALVAFDTYIRTQPGDRPKVEAALLPLLSRDNISVAAKGYICRWLGLIGSDASVPALEKLTSDPQVSHLAVYALLCLESPAAKTALLNSLGHAPADLRPAIIGAIGRSGFAEAVSTLAPMVASDDATQAAAALDALGAVGTPDALKVLQAATVPTGLQATRQWAMLHAASHISQADPSDREEAKSVFATLDKPGVVSSLRVAAARGYILADPAGAWTEIAPLLKDDDEKVRLDVAKLTAQLPSDTIAALAKALPGFDPAVQVVIVHSLADKQSAEVEPVLQAALASAQPDVHLAAITGYGIASLPGSAAVLLPLLAKEGDDSTAAMASLEKVAQPDVSAQLKTAVATAQGPAKAALLIILGARVDRSALDLFFAATGDADNAVAEAAFQGIDAVVGPDDLNRVVGLLPQAKTGGERKSVDAALLRCARGAPDKDKTADFLLGAVQGLTGDVRNALLVTLASLDSPKATSGLQSLLKAPTVDDRKEVIRALSSAHNPGADKLLLDAASHGTEDSEKVLALRGYLDSIREQKLHDREKVEAYKAAWPLATRDDDKQAILDALKNMGGNDAKKAVDELSAEVHKPA